MALAANFLRRCHQTGLDQIVQEFVDIAAYCFLIYVVSFEEGFDHRFRVPELLQQLPDTVPAGLKAEITASFHIQYDQFVFNALGEDLVRDLDLQDMTLFVVS